jgi:dCTP deaminase
MGLKPDTWIRKLALEEGMIDPFLDGQKRNGVISYGLSSYGYDIRVADEFMVFTPGVGNLTVVDPKNIDPHAMVEFTGDVCIIPPNSFALARSLEYMRMPRNVLGTVLGKSTYARCFRGDTRVALVDGTHPTLEEMATRAQEGELFWGYSVGPFGRIIVTLLEAPRYVGRDALLEIELDSGKRIHCTPDHQFLTRDGRMVPAEQLRADAALMPLYRKLVRGYEAVYQPLNGHLYPTHRLADEWNLRHGVYEDVPDTHRHHVDHNRLNNVPLNITRMDASEHISLHNAESYGDDFDPDEHSAAIRDALARLAEDDDWLEHYTAVQRERALKFWHDEDYAEIREQMLEKRRAYWRSEEARQKQRERMTRYWQEHPEQREVQGQRSTDMWERASEARRDRQREIMRRVRTRKEITAEVVRAALHATGSIRGAARLLECDRSVFRRFPEVIREFKGLPSRDNHRVVSVRALPGDHDVYCLTVPEAGNFALEAGVFVRNCGIVTNFTPLEPGWHGYITIEISNTTPLPAKIYANEGIAQVLFFEGDEPCEVSYADKKGKYQGQTGVVLPRL